MDWWISGWLSGLLMNGGRIDVRDGKNGRSGSVWVEGWGALGIVRFFSAVGFAAEDVVGFFEDHFADFVIGERTVLFGGLVVLLSMLFGGSWILRR